MTAPEAYEILKQRSKRGRPVAADSFVTRVARALDVDLAKLCDICEEDPVQFLETLTGSKGELVEFDVDPMWHKLYAYVGERIAQALAIRQELDAKMAKDRQKQNYERLRQL
jgi:hypothetical protein